MSEAPPRLPIVLIAAVARNGVIGRSGGMPWTLPGDLAHFRSSTMGLPVLMGRTTFETIGRPLPGRPTVVVSKNPAFAPEGVTVARSVEQGLADADRLGRTLNATAIAVAGGGSLYRALLAQAERLLITEVDSTPEGDVLFPSIDPAQWRVVDRRQAARRPGDSAPYAFVRFERRNLL